MNELVIALVKADDCPMCGGVGRMRIRVVASVGSNGGLVGWIECPLESPASLSAWIDPFIDRGTPGGVA